MDRLDDGQDERTNSVLLNFRASKSLAIFATPAQEILPPQFPLLGGGDRPCPVFDFRR
jgi:hypothetical protein